MFEVITKKVYVLVKIISLKHNLVFSPQKSPV